MNSKDKQTLSTSLERYFNSFRDNIIGIDQMFESPFGLKKLFIQIGLQVGGYTDLLKKN